MRRQQQTTKKHIINPEKSWALLRKIQAIQAICCLHMQRVLQLML